MVLVVLLALGATVCAAVSSVLKHRSSNSRPAAWADRLPRSVASIVANPLFAFAMLFDLGGVSLQVMALRYGDLSVVQPILSAALVISLLLNHAINRTRVSGREMALAGLLVAGLVVFLASSGAMEPQGEVAIGQRTPGLVLGGLGFLLLVVTLAVAHRGSARTGAQALAVAVAAIYACTAALMKSSTRIFALHGVAALFLSWQLWVLFAIAGLGLVLNQRAFALAPLSVSLPVIASLDPLFSVLVGVVVYDETLRTAPLALGGEVMGLAMLLGAVALLTRDGAEREVVPPVLPVAAGTEPVRTRNADAQD